MTETQASKRDSLLRSILVPSQTAVLTMELQQGVVGEGALLPDLGAEVQRSGTIERAIRVCNGARAVGARVVHCTAVTRPDGLGAAINCKIFAATERLR